MVTSTTESRGQNLGFCTIFGINNSNLATRREFVRLGTQERAILASLAPWAAKNASKIAIRFYDWQFEFRKTRQFFEDFAAARHMHLADLRRALESSQTKYLEEICLFAEENWPLEYFEKRLVVGAAHDRIDLPFKWYIGSYCEYSRLLKAALLEHFGNECKAWEACDAFQVVFNLDMQAISESFLMNTIQSMSLDIGSVQCSNGSDRSEHLGQMKADTRRLVEQGQALARFELNHVSLDKTVAGPLGESLQQVKQALRHFADLMTTSSEALNDVARSAPEMAAAIREVARSSEQANQVAREADDRAGAAMRMISQLDTSSREIGDVVRLIKGVADQTKLLALNATIESAHAGAAGKGFAVVANEVKDLAKQTADATADIERRADVIQKDAVGAIQSINEVTEIVRKINDFSAVIANVVKEQSVTTENIALRVAEAARGTNEISSTILNRK